MEEEISLIELFSILKKRLAMIISVSLLSLIISFIFTFFVASPKYSSTTQMLVSQTAESDQGIQAGDISTNLQLINTYKDIIKGPVILNEVRDDLALDSTNQELSNKIEVTTDTDSQVFTLEVTDGNPYEAANIANTIAETFQEKIYDIMNVDNVTIISEAIPDTNQVSPNKLLNLAIGLLLGLMLGIGIAFISEFLDTTIKDEHFITDELGWTNLGAVNQMTDEERKMEEAVPEREISSRTSRRRV